MDALDKVITEDDIGLKAKVGALEQAANQYEHRFDQLQAENLQLRRELTIFKGIAQRQQEQISVAKQDIVYLTSKSMSKNITISGLIEQKNENCKAVAISFLHDELKVPMDDDVGEIKIAHRVGLYNPEATQPRLMVVKCSLALKNAALEAFKIYKEDREKNSEIPLKFYVNEQLPDMMAEKKREIRHFVWEQKRKDDHLPKGQKANIKVQNDIVYVNKQPVKHRLPIIKLSEMFPDQEMQEKLDATQLVKSSDRTSKWKGSMCCILH